MTTRVTKKNCSVVGEHLTEEFIQKALTRYPVEILNNPQLKILADFGESPCKFYTLYHERQFPLESIYRPIYEDLRDFNKKEAEICSLILSLNPHIPDAARLVYALNLSTKVSVKTFIKYYPDYADWDFLLTQVKKYFAHKPPGFGLNPEVKKDMRHVVYKHRGIGATDDLGHILNFYQKIESDRQVVFSKVKEVLNKTYTTSRYNIRSIYGLNIWWHSFVDYSAFIENYLSFILKEEPPEEIEFFWKVFQIGVLHHLHCFKDFSTNLIWEKSLKDPKTFIVIVNKLEKKLRQRSYRRTFLTLNRMFIKKKREVFSDALFEIVCENSSDLNEALECVYKKSIVGNWVPHPWVISTIEKLKKYYALRGI